MKKEKKKRKEKEKEKKEKGPWGNVSAWNQKEATTQ
jgi:hypothetical protein